MRWFARWKAKYWDEAYTPEPPGSPFIRIHGDRPPLRRAWDWLVHKWQTNPLDVLKTVFAAAAVLVAVIALLLR